jgi:uncharacterized protein
MYADHLLRPWLDRMLAEYPGVRIFDSHTHVGENDPSGFTATFTEVEESLAMCDGRAAVFPLAEPGSGYEKPNLQCAERAAQSDGRLVSLVRLTPDDRPAQLLAEGLAAGARGLKLHPSSDEFSLDDPRLAEVLAIADADRLPVVVHGGPELEGIGETALSVCHRYQGLRMIIAHCALTDLGWIAGHVPGTPNLFFDTSWWGAAHVMALFRLMPPGRILSASDLPYCSPLSGALETLRCAHQAGLDAEQIASVLGDQFQRLVDAEEPLEVGRRSPLERSTISPILEILTTSLIAALEPMQRGDGPGTPLDVARHACKVPDDHPDAQVIGSVAQLIDLYDEHHEHLPHRNQFAPGWDLVSAAAIVARTPSAPVPES